MIVLATDELKQLTSKLESLLARTSDGQSDYKSLLQSLLDEVKASNAAVLDEVKRSNADVVSKLQSIMGQFQSKSRDVDLVRTLASFDTEARDSKLAAAERRATELEAQLLALEKQLQTTRNRESQLSQTLSAERAAVAAQRANESALVQSKLDSLAAALNTVQSGKRSIRLLSFLQVSHSAPHSLLLCCVRLTVAGAALRQHQQITSGQGGK